MGYMKCSRTSQFTYFDTILNHTSWYDKKILDFGGNVGGFLVNADDAVNHRNYWCVDIIQAALDEGRQHFPEANFVHYNRYSSEFNPDGVPALPIPDLGQKFDTIMAFSVFTHTHKTEMFELVGQLRNMLAPGGVLAFTFTDPGYDKSLTAPELPAGTDVRRHATNQKAAHPSLDVESIVDRAGKSKWCILIDGTLYVEPDNSITYQERIGKPWESYLSYFTTDYMASLFPDARIAAPVPPEWQHCCVLNA